MSEAKARDVVYDPSNLMHLCGDGVRGCHGVITNTRREFYGAGWCVRREHDPAGQAVMYRGSWAMLDDEGGVTPIDQVVPV